MREPRHVPGLRASRLYVRGLRAQARRVNTAAIAFARSSARPRRFAFDTVLLLTVGALLLLGLVMMTSASISIADKQVDAPLYYFERQMVGVGLGMLAAIVAMAIPTTVWERLSL